MNGYIVLTYIQNHPFLVKFLQEASAGKNQKCTNIQPLIFSWPTWCKSGRANAWISGAKKRKILYNSFASSYLYTLKLFNERKWWFENLTFIKFERLKLHTLKFPQTFLYWFFILILKRRKQFWHYDYNLRWILWLIDQIFWWFPEPIHLDKVLHFFNSNVFVVYSSKMVASFDKWLLLYLHTFLIRIALVIMGSKILQNIFDSDKFSIFQKLLIFSAWFWTLVDFERKMSASFHKCINFIQSKFNSTGCNFFCFDFNWVETINFARATYVKLTGVSM